MPPVKNVGEPCAGEPHARFDAAAGGNQASRQARAAPAPPADPTATLDLRDTRTHAEAAARRHRCDTRAVLSSRIEGTETVWSQPAIVYLMGVPIRNGQPPMIHKPEPTTTARSLCSRH